jgi:hypothetical protein
VVERRCPAGVCTMSRAGAPSEDHAERVTP